MAYTAIYEGEERGAFEVPFQEDAYCIECGARMRVWREAEDGTARHFKEVGNMGGGGGGHAEGCGGGESDDHQKWKNFAAERLTEVFDNVAEVSVEMPLAAPKTGKELRSADAAVMFEERDNQLGSGLAVEVQHKNESKDIEATTRDYVAQDAAVVWLSGDDFHADGCRLTEADFRKLAEQAVSISMFRDENHRSDSRFTEFEMLMHKIRVDRELLNVEDCDYHLEPRESHVPATLPPEWHDEEALSIWRSQDWSSLFSGYDSKDYIERFRDHFTTEGCRATVEFELLVPEESLRKWYRKGVKDSSTKGNRFYVTCPNCESVSGPYSPMMSSGTRQCSCGTTFRIDIDNHRAGKIIE
ncbi:hypothetical protein [Natronomonas amylolytica]|uniref:hypothetical protein n=1 Tax=Natronomonas amylolytica TaxID=3108498 RepID=UPI00300B78F2